MGMRTEYEQMSDTYRRIKKKRAREKRRRARRMRIIRLMTAFCIGLFVIIGIGLFIFGKKKGDVSKKSSEENQIEQNVAVSGNNSVGSNFSNVVVEETIPEPETKEYPKLDEKFESIADADIASPYIAVYDVAANRILAGRQASTVIYPASMTKVMTLIVAVEHLKDLNATFEMTAEIIDPLVRQEASRAGFEPGEHIRVEDLLYGLILPSGADAANAISQMVAGSDEAFARLMNEKCKELGLKNTHFTNPSGLHDANQYSTPLEIAVIMAYAMENELCAKVLSTYQYIIPANEFRVKELFLESTMFSRMYGDEAKDTLITAGKTGYTVEAGNCLVSYAIKNDKAYIVTVAGENGKWASVFDSFKLYERYAN